MNDPRAASRRRSGMNQGVLASIVTRFAARITIRVGRDAFFVSKGDVALTLGTYLYLEPGPPPQRVMTVGEEPPDDTGLLRVDLFGPAPEGTRPLRLRYDCLVSLFRQAIARTSRGRWIIRPHVAVIGLENLEPVLHGYQDFVLEQALVEAGAAKIAFPELEGPQA